MTERLKKNLGQTESSISKPQGKTEDCKIKLKAFSRSNDWNFKLTAEWNLQLLAGSKYSSIFRRFEELLLWLQCADKECLKTLTECESKREWQTCFSVFLSKLKFTKPKKYCRKNYVQVWNMTGQHCKRQTVQQQNLGALETVRICTVFRKTLTLFFSMYLSPTSCT